MGRPLFATFIILATTTTLGSATIQQCGSVSLTATAAGTLPFPMSHTAAVYNNYDSNYLFGGLTSGTTQMNQIYKYSMSAQTTTQVGTLPSTRYGGVVLKDGVTFPKFVYLGVDGDGSASDPIFKFDSFNGNALSTIGQIQTVTENLAAVESTGSQAFVFGGPNYPWTNITKLDMRYGNNSIVGDLLIGMANKGTAVNPIGGSNITIVGAAVTDTQLDSRVLSFHSSGYTSDFLATIQDLPDLDHHAAAYDYDNNVLWIIGGYNGEAGLPINGIYQIDMSNLAVQFYPVSGFPSSGNMWLSATSAIYAQGRYKIYFFGGLMRDSSIASDPGTQVNNVWVIDLSPAYCCGKGTGLFPHPDDCKKFLSCANSITHVLQCPAPLYFDPVLKICNFLNLVTCALSNLLQF